MVKFIFSSRFLRLFALETQRDCKASCVGLRMILSFGLEGEEED